MDGISKRSRVRVYHPVDQVELGDIDILAGRADRRKRYRIGAVHLEATAGSVRAFAGVNHPPDARVWGRIEKPRMRQRTATASAGP